jgi:hypothetical protein
MSEVLILVIKERGGKKQGHVSCEDKEGRQTGATRN